MHTASMSTPPIPKKLKTFRVTVPVTLEVLESFQMLATASGMSTGKAMGTFLEDMIESVQYLANKVHEARAAPKIVARELHAYALGLADETGQLMRDLADKGRAERGQGARDHRSAAHPDSDIDSSSPPSSNTGGKVPRVNPNPRGLKS